MSASPGHLELLGSMDATVAATAERIAGLSSDGTVIIPVGANLPAPYIRKRRKNGHIWAD